MSDASGFAKFVPGFDFLQSLVSNAGAALPNVGQWIVPSLDPDELDKRINELRTVQFWLEQNSRMLATTIQALEVQRMTLSTLRGMNVSMGELQAGLAAAPPERAAAGAAAAQPGGDGKASAPTEASGGASTVDPMQWWGSLTQQFSKLAADAMRQAAEATGPVAPPPAAAEKPAAPPVPRKARPAAKSARAGGGARTS